MMNKTSVGLLFGALLVLVLCSSAFGAERMALSGVEVALESSGGRYAYVGLLSPWPGGQLGKGLVQRYWLDYVEYEYESGVQTIKTKGLGLESALGWESSGSWGYSGIYAGLRFMSANLSPNDPGSKVQGENVRPKVQFSGELFLNESWRLGGGASYTFCDQAYWTSIHFKRRITEKLFTGPVGIYQGDPDYTAWSAAWGLWGFSAPFGGELSIQAGFRRVEGAQGTLFVGVGVLKSF